MIAAEDGHATRGAIMYRSYVAIGLLAVAVSVLGCAGRGSTVQMTSTREIPAAEGTVKVSTGDNENTRLQVDVRHLAQPSRVEGGTSVYVVWIRGVNSASEPQNVGALVVDKDLNGKLETVTPLRVFDLFLTAEPSARAMAPTGKELLSVQVNRN
jgi:hypothetical protein